MLDKKILNQIHTIVDEFYPAKQMLKKYKNEPDVPLGFLMCVTTRVKIYSNIQELLRCYKKHEPYSALLSRVLKQLRLHRFQIKKLSKTHSNDHESVNKYCVGLAALVYILFEKEIAN